MINEINIVFGGPNWFDLTNDKWIGGADALIEYINSNKLRVKNEDSFLYSDKFWYNKEVK